jgi:hypothetical protein
VPPDDFAAVDRRSLFLVDCYSCGNSYTIFVDTLPNSPVVYCLRARWDEFGVDESIVVAMKPWLDGSFGFDADDVVGCAHGSCDGLMTINEGNSLRERSFPIISSVFPRTLMQAEQATHEFPIITRLNPHVRTACLASWHVLPMCNKSK